MFRCRKILSSGCEDNRELSGCNRLAVRLELRWRHVPAGHVFSADDISWLRREVRVVCSHHSQPVLRTALPSCPISWLPTTVEAAAVWRRIHSPCNCWAELIQRCVMWRGTRSMIGWLRDCGRSITDRRAQYLNIRLQTCSAWCLHLIVRAIVGQFYGSDQAQYLWPLDIDKRL